MDEQIEITTERFILRPLTESDVTERYLNWFRDPDSQRFIPAAATTTGLDDLSTYVCEKIARQDVVFLGIFEKRTRLHIGNIKYEPVDSKLGYAIMGILIGDPDYRGRGVTGEVLTKSARWLQRYRGVNQIVLGVEPDNFAAIRAYQKVGFVSANTQFLPNHPSTMVWDL